MVVGTTGIPEPPSATCCPPVHTPSLSSTDSVVAASWLASAIADVSGEPRGGSVVACSDETGSLLAAPSGGSVDTRLLWGDIGGSFVWLCFATGSSELSEALIVGSDGSCPVGSKFLAGCVATASWFSDVWTLWDLVLDLLIDDCLISRLLSSGDTLGITELIGPGGDVMEDVWG